VVNGDPQVLVRQSELAQGEVMNALNMVTIDITRDRLLVTLTALLLSVMVLAEQSGESLSYDDLMKDTIYGNAGRWRSEATTVEYDWREPKDEDSSFSYNSAGNANWGSDKREHTGDQFNAETSEPGYRLFKIEI
jgi:hypothetical protein